MSETPEPTAEPPRAPRRAVGHPKVGRPRLGRGALVVLSIVAILLLALLAARKILAREILVGWLHARGVEAEAQVEGLSLNAFTGSLTAGPRARPDISAPRIEVRYGLTGFWSGEPFGMRVISMRVTRPAVRAAIRGGKLSIGSLDPIIQDFMRRPPQPNAAEPQILIEGGVLWLTTDYGQLRVRADARMQDGKLMRLLAVTDPARLTGPTFAADLGAGRVQLRTQGGRANILMDAPVTRGEVRLAAQDATPAQTWGLEAGRLHLSLDAPYPDLQKQRGDGAVLAAADVTAAKMSLGAQRLDNGVLKASFQGQVRGWIDDLTVTGAGTASLNASGAEVSGARLSTVDLTAVAREMLWTRRRGDALSTDLMINARLERLVLADLTVDRAAAALEGPVTFGRAGLAMSMTGAVLGHGAYRGLGAPAAADSDLILAIKRGAADFTLAAPQVGFTLGEGAPSLRLPLPVRVRTESGAQAALSGEGAGYRLALAGGGLPTVDARVRRLVWRADGAEIEGEVSAQASIDPIEGGAVDAAGIIRTGSNGVSFTASRCVTLKARRLAFGENSFNDLAGSLCPTPSPLFATTPRGWRLAGRLEGVQANAPAFQVAVSGGSGQVAAQSSGGRLSAQLTTLAAQVRDQSPALRFHPLQAKGRAALADEVLTADAVAGLRADQPLAGVQVTHDMRTGRGGAFVATEALTFAEGGLQPLALSPLAGAVGSPVTGQAKFEGRFDWSADGVTSSGTLAIPRLDFVSPAGKVEGLSGTIAFTSLAPLATAADQTLSIRSVASIAPVTDISAKFEIVGETLRVSGGQAQVGGGQARLQSLEIPLKPDPVIRGVIEIEGVQIHDMVEASPFGDKVDLQARLTGRIPFETVGGALRVREGDLRAIEPGRLSIQREAISGLSSEGAQALAQSAPANTQQAVSGPFADFAYQAMENLAFDQLDAKLNSLPEGRLGILFHLRGRHDPPVKQRIKLTIGDIIARRFMSKPLPLPSGTQVNLTLDTTINLDDLLNDFGDYQKLRHSGDVQP